MKNLVFVIWLLTFPITTALADYLDVLAEGPQKYPESTEALASIIWLVIYIWIATLLYEGKNRKKKEEVVE